MLDAFHSNWTAPFFRLKKERKYYVEDFEILTTMLSALEWQKTNGNIKMVTDEAGAEFYRKIGIDSIWNLGIDDSLGRDMDKEIDPKIFWAAGKIKALKKQNVPCIMIDTDFIVWKSLKKKGYNIDRKFNWQVKPFNTALAYINDKKFLDFYTESSLNFMKNLIDSEDRLINMVFAEQRMFSMCAEKLNLQPKELMPLEELSKSKQEYFTHVWGLKDIMRKDFNVRKRFCKRCIERIIDDFPQYEKNIADMKVLKHYYEEIKLERNIQGSVK